MLKCNDLKHHPRGLIGYVKCNVLEPHPQEVLSRDVKRNGLEPLPQEALSRVMQNVMALSLILKRTSRVM